MKFRWALIAVMFSTGCSSKDEGGTVTGTASVAGKPAKIQGCKRARDDDGRGTHTELQLDTGHVIYWGIPDTQVRKDGKTVPVECHDTTMDEENGKGTWKTTCDHPDGEIVLDVTYRC